MRETDVRRRIFLENYSVFHRLVICHIVEHVSAKTKDLFNDFALGV